MLRDRPVRALTVGSLSTVCGIVTLLPVKTNCHDRSWARWARTERTGGPACPETSMNTPPGQGAALRPPGLRSVGHRDKPREIKGIERHGLGAKFPPNFFCDLRAARSDVSRLRHPVHRTDASTGRGSLNRQSCRPSGVTRSPPPPGGTQERAENPVPASGLRSWIRRVAVSGRSGGHRAFESQRRCGVVRPVNLRWTIASSRSTEVT